jgi:tetratricopeptide (TPR) repeat protein
VSRFIHLEFQDANRSRKGTEDSIGTKLGESHRLAQEKLREGDFEQALRWYSRAQAENPNDAGAWAGQVQMLLELGDAEQAKRWADQALERFPQNPTLLAAKAFALARLGEFESAMAFSDSSVEEGKENPFVWLSRGAVFAGHYEDRAEHCFTRVLEYAKGDWLWGWLIARVCAYHEQFVRALKYLKVAMASETTAAVVWLEITRCQIALGLGEAAQHSLLQTRQLNPRLAGLQELTVEVQSLPLHKRMTGFIRRWFSPGL